MMNLAILENDPKQAKLLRQLCRDWFDDMRIPYHISEFPDSEALFGSFEKDTNYNILLVNMEMTGETGMNFKKKLRTLGDQVSVIFTTAPSWPALEGYEAQAIDYLNRPVKKDKLCQALERAYLASRKEEFLFAEVDGDFLKLAYSDILYLESSGHSTLLHTKKGDYLSKKPLSFYEDAVRSHAFFKCHRSYLVNLSQADSVGKSEICLKDQKIPVARGKWESLHQIYAELTGV